MSETKKDIRYWTFIKYGRRNICEVEVLKETEKTYQIKVLRRFIGSGYVPSRVIKEDGMMYRYLPDAWSATVGTQQDKIRRLEENLKDEMQLLKELQVKERESREVSP